MNEPETRTNVLPMKAAALGTATDDSNSRGTDARSLSGMIQIAGDRSLAAERTREVSENTSFVPKEDPTPESKVASLPPGADGLDPDQLDHHVTLVRVASDRWMENAKGHEDAPAKEEEEHSEGCTVPMCCFGSGLSLSEWLCSTHWLSAKARNHLQDILD